MLHQTITTLEQQHWITKLLGFNFDILYQPRLLNVPVNALSRLHDPSLNTLLTTSCPLTALWEALHQSYQ